MHLRCRDERVDRRHLSCWSSATRRRLRKRQRCRSGRRLPRWRRWSPSCAAGQPLVGYADCRALRRRLAAAALGHALVVQAGDCAELFAEVSDRTSDRKRAQLSDLVAGSPNAVGLPSVRSGRIAGQFAKPRSCASSPDRAASIPVYRGDAVNTVAPTAAGRAADPRRLADRVRVLRRRPAALDAACRGPVWTSHEAMLIEYEEPLVRHDPDTGARYASSAHLLWVGERTRSAAGPQIALLAGVANPVAVKLGPSATPARWSSSSRCSTRTANRGG